MSFVASASTGSAISSLSMYEIIPESTLPGPTSRKISHSLRISLTKPTKST